MPRKHVHEMTKKSLKMKLKKIKLSNESQEPIPSTSRVMQENFENVSMDSDDSEYYISQLSSDSLCSSDSDISVENEDPSVNDFLATWAMRHNISRMFQ